MMHGGDYWQKKTDDAFAKSASKTIFDPNNAGIQNQTQSSAHSTAATKLKGDSGPVGKRSQKKVFGIIAALAAAVLIMVSISQFIGNGQSVAKGDWGFAKSGLLESNVSESEMLEQLAKASGAWHNKTPQTSEELANRLRQFDQGCQSLLASNLPQLSQSNRNAVHAACEDCREAIAIQLAAIANGADFATTQANANTAIDKLTHSLERLS